VEFGLSSTSNEAAIACPGSGTEIVGHFTREGNSRIRPAHEKRRTQLKRRRNALPGKRPGAPASRRLPVECGNFDAKCAVFAFYAAASLIVPPRWLMPHIFVTEG